MGDNHLTNPAQRPPRPGGGADALAPAFSHSASPIAADEPENRGHPATISKDGEVVGSGAGAGGSGGREDFDSDAAAGDSRPELPLQHAPDSEPDNGNS
jgi:hypothetical protein